MEPILAVVLPVFAVMMTGYLAALTPFFSGSHNAALSSFVFNFAIPVMLIRSLSQTELPDQIQWSYLIAFFASALLTLATAFAIASAAGQDRQQAAILGFASAYGNTVLIGIPIVLMAFGDAAALPLFLMISVHALILFTTATLVLETINARAKNPLKLIISSFKGLLRNPIFLSLLLGIALNFMDVRFHGVIDRWAELLGQAAVPCALFAMGASLKGYRIQGDLKIMALPIAFKLLVLPALVYLLGHYVFALEPLWLNTAVILAALPTGVNVYLFANRYDAAVGLSASAILLSTLISILSLSVILALLLPTV